MNPTVPSTPHVDAAISALHAEHNAIDKSLSQLRDAILAGSDDTWIVNILDRAIAFCKKHFAHEEEFLRQYGYGQVEEHTNAHLRLLQRFDEIRGLAASSNLGLATLEAADLLHDFHLHASERDRTAYEEIAGQSNTPSPMPRVS